MLVGLEFYAFTTSTPLDELAQFQRDNVHPLDSLPVIVAHEHTHILQALLAITEVGGSDAFLAESGYDP